MVGYLAIYAAFIFTLAVVLFYLGVFLFSRHKLLPLARYAYYLKSIFILLASVYLLWGLLTHRFHYYYVYAHTSTDLPFKYLLSAFWAGQEGTFLLWALLAAAAGLGVIKGENSYEYPVMIFVAVGQAFLLLFLILYSPFRIVDPVPLEGLGLNPLLMDPWMVIHPPVIFVGYALLILPCAYALAGLWKKDYQGWTNRALPWALAGWLFLGAGIIIGGYWAYKVLGWGGYWGWDPVENASLVPWLTCTALVHGMLVQKARSVNIRSNLFFAIITFVFIIYATFLTRSGILADFSVHAFTETGLNPYMLAFLLFYLLAGAALLVTRWRDIPAGPEKEEAWHSKVSTFSYTILLLSLSAMIITMGTSSPIITGLWGNPASVETSFYGLTNGPIAVLLVLVMAVCPLLKWREEIWVKVRKRLVGPLIFTSAGLLVAFFLGVSSPLHLLFLGSSLLALGTNSVVLYREARQGYKNMGGYLAHGGVAIMLIGILASSAFSESSILFLKEGESEEALGYKILFQEEEIIQGKDYFYLEVQGNGKTYQAVPRMYLAGSRPMLMREPYIIRGVFKDIYLSPLEKDLEQPGETVILSQGEMAEVGGYDILFKEFSIDFPMEAGMIQVGAVLEVGEESSGVNTQITPTLTTVNGERNAVPVEIPGGEDLAIVENLDANQKVILLRVFPQDSPPPENLLVLEVSSKPLVSILALGSLMLLAGTALATWRRFSHYYF